VPTPGFPAGTLDEHGFPVWLDSLNSEDGNYALHVARDLAATEAMLLLGVRPGMITPCQLAAHRPDRWTSLPRASIDPTDSGAVLLAGRIGAWTFVYDDGGFTTSDEHGDTPAKLLSANRGEAASITEGDTLNPHFGYAADGVVLFEIDYEDIDAANQGIPAGLRPAVESAGILEPDVLEDGHDFAINARVVCALAGLQLTLNELRQIPLLVAPFS
jgi:hypothetical protein